MKTKEKEVKEVKEKEVTQVKVVILNQDLSRIILGLTDIGNLDIEDFRLSYGITRTIANISTAEKVYLKCLNVLRKKCVKIGEDGDFVIVDRQYVFNSPEDKKYYMDNLQILDETVVDVRSWLMKTSQLEKVKGIKGMMMAKCSELIVDDLGIME